MYTCIFVLIFNKFSGIWYIDKYLYSAQADIYFVWTNWCSNDEFFNSSSPGCACMKLQLLGVEFFSWICSKRNFHGFAYIKAQFMLYEFHRSMHTIHIYEYIYILWLNFKCNHPKRYETLLPCRWEHTKKKNKINSSYRCFGNKVSKYLYFSIPIHIAYCFGSTQTLQKKNEMRKKYAHQEQKHKRKIYEYILFRFEPCKCMYVCVWILNTGMEKKRGNRMNQYERRKEKEEGREREGIAIGDWFSHSMNIGPSMKSNMCIFYGILYGYIIMYNIYNYRMLWIAQCISLLSIHVYMLSGCSKCKCWNPD